MFKVRKKPCFLPGNLIRLISNNPEAQCFYLVLEVRSFIDYRQSLQRHRRGFEYKILYPIGQVGLMRISIGCERNFEVAK